MEKKHSLPLILAVALTLTTLVQSTTLVLAQEDTLAVETAQPTTSQLLVIPATTSLSDLVVETTSDADQIKTLQVYYQQAILQYRTYEREALVSQTQYQQLRTLSSLEEAVVKTKLAESSRDEVLATHISLLFFELRSTLGVNLTQKEPTLKALELSFTALKEHKQQVDAVTTRDELVIVTDSFIELGAAVQSVSDQAQVLITLGRLQTVHDNSRVTLEKIAKEFENSQLSPSELSKQQRALVVTRDADAKLTSLFQITYQDMERYSVGSRWTNLQEGLTDIYGNLSQLLAYLEELAQNTQSS